MGRRFRTELGEWSGGASTEVSPEKIPLNTTPRALNSAWIAQGIPAKRKGFSIITPAGPSGVPAALAIGHFDDIDWAIFDNGKWEKFDETGAYSDIDAGTATPFTSGTNIPITAIANGNLFVVNGQERLRTDGGDIWNFGIDAPTAPTLANTAGAFTMDGVYRVALTRYNSTTGHESSLSAYAEITLSTDKLKVTFPAAAFSGDAQVDTIRIHIFKVGLTDRFFRTTDTNAVPDAGTYSSTTGGYTSATSYVTFNLTDANITDLIIQSPNTHENNRPPTGTTFIGYHNSRMYATDGTHLYFSKIDDPESFDTERFERVNPDNGEELVGFISLTDKTDSSVARLLILKERSAFILSGPNDPNTWEIDEIDPTVGLAASRALIATDGGVWWKAEQGFYRLVPGSVKPERMDSLRIGNRTENIAFDELSTAVAEYDTLRQRILFAVPALGESRNTIILPYNLRLGLWEDTWDPMDISAMGTLFDTDTMEPYVVVGNYKGRLFRVWADQYVDGARTADGVTPFTLSGTVEAATANTLTDSGANFDTVADGLDQIPVVVVSADGVTQRNIIASSTGTVLTLVNNWGVTPDDTWAYYIGSPNFEFDIKYLSPSLSGEGSPFNSRTFKHMLAKGISDTGSATLDVYAILDHAAESFAKHVQVTLEGSGALFDVDLFDAGVFGTGRATVQHKSLGLRGRVLGLRVVNRDPSVGIILLGLGVAGTEFGFKV